MRSFPDCFNLVDIWGADFATPIVNEQTMVVAVRGLGICPSHPLALAKDKVIIHHPVLGRIVDGLLVFRGVYLSRRMVVEYIGDPMNLNGFKDPYVIEDINIDVIDETLNIYDFEGSLDEPPAFVTWKILACSFELQVV